MQYRLMELVAFIIGASIWVFLTRPETPITNVGMGVLLAYIIKFVFSRVRGRFSC
jgi:multisubunit Na+/H+ antiporter MnhE subunit